MEKGVKKAGINENPQHPAVTTGKVCIVWVGKVSSVYVCDICTLRTKEKEIKDREGKKKEQQKVWVKAFSCETHHHTSCSSASVLYTADESHLHENYTHKPNIHQSTQSISLMWHQ